MGTDKSSDFCLDRASTKHGTWSYHLSGIYWEITEDQMCGFRWSETEQRGKKYVKLSKALGLP